MIPTQVARLLLIVLYAYSADSAPADKRDGEEVIVRTSFTGFTAHGSCHGTPSSNLGTSMHTNGQPVGMAGRTPFDLSPHGNTYGSLKVTLQTEPPEIEMAIYLTAPGCDRPELPCAVWAADTSAESSNNPPCVSPPDDKYFDTVWMLPKYYESRTVMNAFGLGPPVEGKP